MTIRDYHGIQIDLDRDQSLDHFAMDLLEKHYMLPDETSPQEAYARAALAYCYGDLALAQRIYDYASKGWFMYASPVLSNAPKIGQKTKALPISCYLLGLEDNLESLISHSAELKWLSVKGGGIGGHWSKIRSVSDLAPGPISFLKSVDSDILAYSQGKTRRGSYAAYLDVSHPDLEEFLNIRVPTGGDANRKCLNLHNAINITDNFMQAVINDQEWNFIDPNDKSIRGTTNARKLWERILEVRFRTGEPYLCFIDEANRHLPQPLKDLGLKINGSNLCVSGDQRVSSDRGLLTAKELYDQGGDLILFDNNKKVTASPMQLIEKNADVYKITLRNGMTHSITNYHKVKTLNGNMECHQLKIGDSIAVQTNKGLFGSVDMKHEAFLLGLYQADGTQYKKKIMIDIWENDFDLEKEIQNSFNYIFYKYGCDKFEVKNQTGKTGIYKTINPPKFKDCIVNQSKVKKRRLESNALSKALNFKKGSIPQWIWEGTEETQWEYIRGLFYADGTVNIAKTKGNPLYLSLTSINKEFLCELQLLLSNLGMQSAIGLFKKEGQALLPDGKGGEKYYKAKESWRITIGNKNDALEFEKHTKFLTRKNKYVEPRQYRDNTKKFHKIVKIEYLGKQDVFCCTVNSQEHHWICNGIITHNCIEIFQPTSHDRTAVCCLSSLNLEKYDLWKSTPIVRDLIRFLDNVLQFFIDNAPDVLSKSKYSATRERSLGLGTMGFHAYLQQKMIPWESAIAKSVNIQIFSKIKEQAVLESQLLAQERGEYPDGIGTGMRNSHLLALAPNANNSIILSTSASIDPRKANAYTHRTRIGSFLVKNPYLANVLEKYAPIENKETWLEEIWSSIITTMGSVQHLEFLSETEKLVFKTAFEIDQNWVVAHAADRQPFICQGQSVNLFFPAGSDRSYVNQAHLKAWKEGLKGLYYLRTNTGVTAEKVSHKIKREALADYAGDDENKECVACQG